MNVFKGKQNGVFVEVGAYDGFDISNTYHFEKDLNWTGICIEPSPQSFEKLKQNRNCILENCAISDVEGELDFVNVTGWGSSGSGFNDIDGLVLKTAKKSVEVNGGTWEIIKVPSFRLETILNKHKIRMVDYMSIDTEGHEMSVIKSINWNQFYIQFITIENSSSFGDNMIEYFKQFSYSVMTGIGGDLVFKLDR
jgi:FkbM family methyltransferase